MRLLLALACAVLVLLAWLAFAPSRSAPRPAETALDSSLSSIRIAEQHTTTLDVPDDALELTAVGAESATHRTVPAYPRAACRIFGRIVNDLGAPIVGARFVLREWGEFPAVMQTHEAASSSDGGFSLDLAAPETPKQSLEISHRPFHVLTERWFGDVKVAEGRRLVAGEVDLGTIVLARCGAVEGRVLSDDGVLLDGIGIMVESSSYGARGSVSNQDGTYSISEVPPGRFVVTVKHAAWLPVSKIVVEVEPLRVTVAPDLVLGSIPTIEGIVVDPSGRPLSGIAVELWSQMGVAITRGINEPDGSFVVQLPDREPATLSIPETCAYRGFGGRMDDPTCTYQPGARGVRIVLERMPEMTFRVVDAATRQSLQRFALWVICNNRPIKPGKMQPEFAGDARVRDHPSGSVTHPAGERARVCVSAPGHAPVELDVVADTNKPNVQTIALARGASITGRVLVAGRPADRAKLSAALEAPGPSNKLKVSQWRRGLGSGNGWDSEFFTFPNAPDVITDESGIFSIGDLAAGTYKLGVNARHGARTILRGLVVPTEGVLALGDVEIAPEAIVRGVVRTPPGQSPVGALITLENYDEVRVREEDGRFELGSLGPGKHWLVWSIEGEKRQLDSNDPRRIDFELAPGETREIVIDTAAVAPCAVTVRVLRNGVPVPNAFLHLKRVSDVTPPLPDWRGLGRTNEYGIATGSADGGLRAQIVVLNEAKQVIGWSAEEIEFVAGGSHECSISVATGTLVVQLPATLERPEIGRIMVKITGGHQLTARAGSEWISDLVDFREVSTAVRDVQIVFERFERDTTTQNPKAGRWIELRRPFQTSIDVKDGGTTRVVVP